MLLVLILISTGCQANFSFVKMFEKSVRAEPWSFRPI